MPYIKRSKLIRDRNFAEYDEYGNKKKGIGKKLLIGAGAAIGGAAALKYGAKGYAKHQMNRAKAAESAAYGSNKNVNQALKDKAQKIRGGQRTQIAQKIGGFGDKQIGKARKFIGENVDKARMSMARDKDKYKAEKQQALQRRVSAAHRNQQRNLEKQEKLSTKMRKEATLRERYRKLANPLE